jgi:hypothetical protein
MIALRWEWVAIGYYTYLLIVALLGRRFLKARIVVLAGTGVCCVVLGALSSPRLGLSMDALTVAIVVPLAVLLGGYWLSGWFFVSPMQRVEQWLMTLDERLLRQSGILAAYHASPRIVHEFFEMAYVLVYAVIPAAVATLAIGGHRDAIPRFWTVVLLAEFSAYGMMPWLQTRPPRALESTGGMILPPSALRRFNAKILERGSIQVNTVPSGHAAGAVATALVVVDAMPFAGFVFLTLAASIVAATVLGRYHYLVDSLLGIVVAAGAWYLCR